MPASATAIWAAAMAYWMKGSILRTSFRSMKSAGTKSFNSAAIRVAWREASNLVMGPPPLTPARRASQDFFVPVPRGVTRPTPVMTTRFSFVF